MPRPPPLLLRLTTPHALQGRLLDRLDDAAPPDDPVPARDTRSTRTGATRRAPRLAEAGPNVPQLIRLVRTPFALATGRPVRRAVVDPPEPRTRLPFAAPREAALAERERVRSTSPARGRTRDVAPRPTAVVALPPPGDPD